MGTIVSINALKTAAIFIAKTICILGFNFAQPIPSPFKLVFNSLFKSGVAKVLERPFKIAFNSLLIISGLVTSAISTFKIVFNSFLAAGPVFNLGRCLTFYGNTI
jgi:hypothetical protein